MSQENGSVGSFASVSSNGSKKRRHFVMTKEQNALYLQIVRETVANGGNRDDCVARLNKEIVGLNTDGASLSAKMTQLRDALDKAADEQYEARKKEKGAMSPEQFAKFSAALEKKKKELYPTFKQGRQSSVSTHDAVAADLLAGFDDVADDESDDESNDTETSVETSTQESV